MKAPKFNAEAHQKSLEHTADYQFAADKLFSVIVADDHGLIIQANHHFCQISGYKEEEIIGKKLLFLNSASHSESLINDIWKIISSGADWHGNLINQAKDGEIYWTSASIVPVLNPDGKPRKFVSIHALHSPKNLIKEQSGQGKKSKKEHPLTFSESGSVFSTVLERVSDAFVALDKNWCYTYMNKKAGEIFDRDPEKIIGKHIWAEFPEGIGQPFYIAYHEAMETQQYRYLEEYYPPYNLWFENHIYPSSDGLTIYFKDISERKHAEEKIRLSEKRLLKAQEIGKLGYWQQDIHSDTVWASKEAMRIFGFAYEDGQISREKIADCILDLDSVIQARKNLVERNIPYQIEFRIQPADGSSIKYIHAMAELEKNKDGEPYRMMGTLHDISDIKTLESKMIHEKNLSKSIINSLPGVFYLYDKNGKFIRWNKNVEIVSGYSAEEISCMHPLDLFDTDEKAILEREINNVFEQGKGEIEAHFLTKTKQKIPYFFNGHKANFEGIDYLLGVGIDITERKKAELALKESEENYHYLFNNNPALIIIWDLVTLKVLEINDVALEQYGYTREEFLQLTVLELRPEEDRNKIKEFSQTMLHGTEFKVKKTWRHVKKNGDIMHMDISSHRIDYHDRKAILSLAKDITEQIQAEGQLIEMFEDMRRLNAHLQTIREEERTSIAREIHDELGQQLTGLKMDASWLRKKIGAEDYSLQEKLNGMMSLIDDTVKTVRRIASDLRPGVLDDLGLAAALEWQSSEFEKRTGIACHFYSDVRELQIEKDLATGIFRIYQETLTNVMRHSGATSVQSVLEQNETDLKLSVHDNGVGFDAIEAKNKKTLGLTGMRERALMLGGEIKINSKNDEGTLVVLTIPLHLKN